jgi:hypothetical protein
MIRIQGIPIVAARLRSANRVARQLLGVFSAKAPRPRTGQHQVQSGIAARPEAAFMNTSPVESAMTQDFKLTAALANSDDESLGFGAQS